MTGASGSVVPQVTPRYEHWVPRKPAANAGEVGAGARYLTGALGNVVPRVTPRYEARGAAEAGGQRGEGKLASGEGGLNLNAVGRAYQWT